MLQFSSPAVILETLLGEEKKKAQTYTVTLTPGCVEKLSSFAAPDKQRKEKRKKKNKPTSFIFLLRAAERKKCQKGEKQHFTNVTCGIKRTALEKKKKKIKQIKFLFDVSKGF